LRFSNPGWLAAGFVACLCLIWLWRRYDVRQHAALAQFVSAHLRSQLTQSVSIRRRRAQRGLLLASAALLFVALAGPLVGYRWEIITRRGNEVIFALDTSRSMSTPDVKPDRLTRAKLAIDDFTNKLDGDAVGLVAFAGSAFLVCPITLDYAAFHESLNAVDVNTIPRGGTNIASAIREAQAALRRRPGSDRILILVTDGEDLEGDAVAAAQAAARQDGLKIYTIGVGTPQGDLIPLTASPNGGFMKDDAGGFVKSRLDEPALKAIAATGGLYAPLGSQGQGFETIYRMGLAPALKHDLASRRQRVYTQRYQWPLAGSLGLLLAGLLIGNRRRVAPRRRHASVPRPSWLDPAAASVLVLLLALSPARSGRASTARAEEAYRKGDYVTAANEYAAASKSDPRMAELQFNSGTAAYRAGQFPQAAQAFRDSISRAPSADAKRLADQEDAYYNLGNTLYRTGQQTEQSAPQQTLQTWNQAVQAYETALQLRRDDADSKFNRDIVKRKIEELQQKQNQQNQSQNQQSPGQQSQQRPQNQTQAQNKPQDSQQQPQPPHAGAPSPGQQPPADEPPEQQQPDQPPPPGADQSKPRDGSPKAADVNDAPPPAKQTDAQRIAGEMSPEEARELLDSQKGEERHALGLPVARRGADTPPDRPRKDW
jgi:Ca-activated chloride channel family protein